MIHTVKGFGVVSKAEVDVFLELSWFFDDATDVSKLISGSSAFSKYSLNIWKFSVQVLLSRASPFLGELYHFPMAFSPAPWEAPWFPDQGSNPSAWHGVLTTERPRKLQIFWK